MSPQLLLGLEICPYHWWPSPPFVLKSSQQFERNGLKLTARISSYPSFRWQSQITMMESCSSKCAIIVWLQKSMAKMNYCLLPCLCRFIEDETKHSGKKQRFLQYYLEPKSVARSIRRCHKKNSLITKWWQTLHKSTCTLISCPFVSRSGIIQCLYFCSFKGALSTVCLLPFIRIKESVYWICWRAKWLSLPGIYIFYNLVQSFHFVFKAGAIRNFVQRFISVWSTLQIP